MNTVSTPAKPPLLAARARALAGSRGARRWGRGILIFLVVFGLLGFFAAPPLIRSVAERELGTMLLRPVTIQHIALNPYTLAFEASGVRIAEADGQGDFVTLGKLRLRPSWSSLFRLKPVVAEVLVDTLHVNIVRTAEQRFNFSDIAESFAKPAPEPKPPSKPLMFSVSNIRLENSRIDFDDRVLGEQHHVEDLRIGVPFVANIPSKIEIDVQPLIEATVDGSRFSLSGKTKPFARSLDSTIALKLDHLELAPLVAYAPVALPVKLPKAQLSTDLLVHFSRAEDQQHVSLGGTVDLDSVAVTDTAGAPLFEAAKIHLAADAIEPLVPSARLSELRIESPVLNVSRDAGGVLNLSRLAPAAGNAPAKAAAEAPATKPASESTPATPAAKDAALPDVALRSFVLSQGRVRYEDHAAGAVQYTVEPLEITVRDLATRTEAPASYSLKAHLAQGGDVALDGSLVVPTRRLEAKLQVAALALPAFQPYLTPFLAAKLGGGTLGLQLAASVDAGAAEPKLVVGASEISVEGLKLVPERSRVAAVDLGRATARITGVDLAARRAELAAIEVERLNLTAERTADGSIDLAQLVRTPKAAPAKAPAPAAARKSAPAEAPWHYAVAQIALSQSALTFTDRSTASPVALRLSGLAAKVSNFSDDAGSKLPVELSGTLQRKGRFAARGTVVREPLQAALNLRGSDLDIATFSPYLATGINASIASLRLGLGGNATVAQGRDGLKAGYKGDVRLGDLSLLNRDTSEPFAGFHELSVTGIRAAYEPAGTDIDIGRIALSDFFAQVLLDANGKLNVGELMKKPAEAAAADSATPAAAAPEAPAAAPAEAAPPPAAPAAPAPAFRLHVGEIALASGKIDYTDNFIKPNFSANLVDFGGTIGTIGTDVAEPAAVDLKARLNESGPVAISGTMNPLAAPPLLDITANAREIELTRFAAYSTKYTGYPIVKGKLQVDLHYALKDNLLKANNHIFIDQFTFGDRVDSPTATNLPVRLAISLLKNSRGEIDVDVPVSGSLSDPKFSVGGVIWRAFLNLITKAVTSPFSLLAGAFGGGADELGYIDFAAGSARLEATQAAKIEKIAKALADRPAIKLDLSAHVDPALDTPGLKAATVERQVKAQKIKDVVGRGESIDVDSITVEPAEYEKYLTRAYKAADIKKPRNAIGIAKSLPVDEMKRLLTESVTVGDAELRQLAERRTAAVQQAFVGKVDASRVFLVAPKLESAPAKAGEDGKDKGSTTRVDFTLKD